MDSSHLKLPPEHRQGKHLRLLVRRQRLLPRAPRLPPHHRRGRRGPDRRPLHRRRAHRGCGPVGCGGRGAGDAGLGEAVRQHAAALGTAPHLGTLREQARLGFL